MNLRTRVPLRHRIAFLLAFAAAITYLDRVCLSAATPSIMAALGLSNMQMGYIFSVFDIAYGAFEIPMGWLSDRFGQRKILTRIVACWSAFTVLTGLVSGYWSLLAVRFAFGGAEAGAFPALTRATENWFKVTDRAKAIGVIWMGARLGGAFAPWLAVLFMEWFGWRIPFGIFGMFGAVWCLIFWRAYRDNPGTHPAATAADLVYAQKAEKPRALGSFRTPWKRILWSGNVWALFWMYFATSYGFYFLVTWLPTFLIRQHKLQLHTAGIYAALPLGIGSIACVTGGSLSDMLVRRLNSLRWGRRLVGLGGYLTCGVGFAGAGCVQNPLPAILFLMLGEIGLDIATPVAWATCIDSGGTLGATLGAFMNVGSCLSGLISPIAAAWVYTKFNSFDTMLISAGALYAVAALLWLKIDPAQPLVGPDEQQNSEI